MSKQLPALKSVQPTRHLYAGHRYTPALETNVADTWARWREQALQPETAESVQASAIADHNSMEIPE